MDITCNITRPSSQYKTFFHLFLLCISIAICYGSSLNNAWHFDDFPNIVKSKPIQMDEINVENIKKTFSNENTGKFSRPIPRLSFAINFYQSQLNTTSYHITNICIHILSTFFAYLVFIQILQLLKKEEQQEESLFSPQDIALLGAILWSIHPIQTQAVTYIVQRMTSMAAMFYIMAMYFYIKSRIKNGLDLKKIFYSSLAILCAIAGILSKENAVLLPLSLILVEITFFKINFRKILYILLLLAVFVLFANTFYLIFTDKPLIGGLNLNGYNHRTFTIWERLLTEPRIIIWYLFLLINPTSNLLALESDILVSTSLFNPITTLFSIILIGLLIIFSIIYLKRYKLVSFAILFFFLNHLVESTILPLELYFEHRNYLPSIFIYLSLSYYFIKSIQFYLTNNKLFLKNTIIVLITVVIIAEGNGTYLRNDIWRTDENLQKDSIKKAPNNIRPYISLAAEYMKYDLEKALKSLKQAEILYKKDKSHHQYNFIGLLYYNAGVIHTRKKNYKKAIKLFNESLKHDPMSWDTYVNIGFLLFKEGDIEKSIGAYTNAITLKKDNIGAYNLLAIALFHKNQTKDAISTLQEGLTVQDSIPLRLNLTGCYLKENNLTLAKRELLKIPHNNQNLQYLLYKSVLFNDDLQSKAIGHISNLLVKSKRSYCELLSEIKENKSPYTIYPDISLIENKINLSYKARLDEVSGSITKLLTASTSCDSKKNSFTENIESITLSTKTITKQPREVVLIK